MPITSLSKITVPTRDGGTEGLLMPKLQYRFRLTFTNFGNENSKELTKQVIDVNRPNLTFEPITLDVYNSRAYIAGKHTWEPITVNIRDDATNNVQKLVGKQLQRQFDFENQASASAGGNYKFETKIEILDGGNGAVGSRGIAPLETFELYGCFIESANYNTLNYATNDAVTISLNIRYDNAKQTNGVGDATIGTVGTGSTNVTSVGRG